MQPSVTNQPVQGGTGGLAQMFRNNAPTAQGAPAQLPQIMAPQRPNIGLPPQAQPLPAPPPVQQQPARPQMPDFGSTSGGGGRWGPGGWVKEKQWSALQKAGLLKSPADLMSGRLQSMGHYGYRGGGQ